MGMLRQNHGETGNQKGTGANDNTEEVKWKREILQHISTCLFVAYMIIPKFPTLPYLLIKILICAFLNLKTVS